VSPAFLTFDPEPLASPHSYIHRVHTASTIGGNETRVISYPKTNFFFGAFRASDPSANGAHGEEPAPPAGTLPCAARMSWRGGRGGT
jgi:hypothetical protein